MYVSLLQRVDPFVDEMNLAACVIVVQAAYNMGMAGNAVIGRVIDRVCALVKGWIGAVNA